MMIVEWFQQLPDALQGSVVLAILSLIVIAVDRKSSK